MPELSDGLEREKMVKFCITMRTLLGNKVSRNDIIEALAKQYPNSKDIYGLILDDADYIIDKKRHAQIRTDLINQK